MAIVTLRAYLDELQALIESEALEEVIGHCKYILQTYPKNVAVYRLLGSALLDKARYQEAADVFQRVLSAVPDDMIAHAAMFQIYQESDAVQPATWHLERAFEQNPNSQPLKDELRSLYGRRDGTPPERIQMTRGGLARAYFQGQLYEQATAELEKILTEEPNRADLLLLLARTYLANNHPVEAGEAALRVLSMLPDALEANALLAQLWLEHQRPSDASPFVERVEALDPFLALKLLKPDDPNAGEALVLSRLDWNARATAALLTETPDWMENMGEMFDASGRPAGSTDPFGLERRATAAQPDWMSNFATPSETPVTASDWFAEAAASAPAPAADPFALPALNSSDDVPDWFAEVSANANQPNRDSNGPTNASRRNQPAPDVENSAWLQDATDFMAAPPPSRDQHSGFTDLLGEITTARQQDEPPPSWVDDLGDALSGTQPDWLNDFSTAASPASLDSSAFGADHPSAIDDLFSNWTPEAATSDASESDWSNVAGADAEPDLTDWMTNFEPAGNDIVPPVNAPAPVSTLTDNKMDSWLSDFGASAEMSNRSAEVNDATDWMTDIAPSESPSGWAAPAETSGTAADSAEDNWLSGFESDHTAQSTSANDVSAWMSDAASSESPSGWAAPAETSGTAADSAEDDWLSGIGGAGLTEAAAEPEAANVPDWMNNFAPSEVPAVEVSPVTIDSGTDDDWMSSLRDIDATEVVAEPETTNVPDWMSALAPSESPSAAIEPAAVASDDDWLSGLSGIDTTETAAEPETVNVSDWMNNFAPSEVPAVEVSPVTIDSGTDDDWMSSLRDVDSTEPETVNVPDWMSALAPSESPAIATEPTAVDSGDDWLSGLGGLDTTEAAAEPETANVPDWMSALAPSESPAAEPEAATIDSGDDWLSGLGGLDTTEAAAEPEVANVPDWMSALAPSESPAIATEPTAVDSGDDWLSGLGGLDATEVVTEPETANVPDWMSALAPSESPAIAIEPATADSGDDWLSGLGGIDTTEVAAEPETVNVPDWMSALAPSESPEVETEPAAVDSGDDWLSGLGGLGTTEVAAESETANVPDWMSALDSNTGTDTLDIPLQPAEDDEWERAFEPDSPTAQLPRPVDVSSVADDEQNNDWLSNVAAQTPSKSDDWLSQFAVIEHSPDLDQAIEGLPSTRDLDQADDTLPDWMRDTERASITSEAATPDWMRDTEKTTISSDIVSDFFGADDEKQESSSGYGQSRHSGMTGLLNAMALPKSEPPAFAGNTDVLDEQTLPDWMTAFTDEIMPEPAAPVEILPDRAAEMTGPDRSNPTEPANDFSDWSQPEPPAKPETMAAPNTAVDESMPIEDELFDSQAIPDWLSALAPADHLDANVTPEPETAILDLSNAEPDIDIDSLLSDAEGGFSGGDEVLDEAQIPAWMRDDEGLVTVPEAQPLAQQPVSQPAAPIPIVPEAEPVAEVEPASGETSGGFTFKRKPAWLTKIKK